MRESNDNRCSNATDDWAEDTSAPHPRLVGGRSHQRPRLFLLALAGVFRSKGATDQAAPVPKAVGNPPLAEVGLLRGPRYETAVDAVRPVHETAVASKLLAKVIEVKIKAGQTVTRDEVLVHLDDADLQARLKQAEAALAAAKSVHDQASTDYQRTRQLLEGKAIARAEYDKFETAFRTVMAELERAQQAVQEAKVSSTMPPFGRR